MASTNKTTHYELSQYVGNDKPTYLTDYNNDMRNIDTGIYNAQTKADTAFANAGSADTKADNAQLTANQALNTAGTANTNIGTMANLNTTDKTSVVNAINEVKEETDEVNERFNFTTFTSYNASAVQNLSNGTLAECSMTLATNEDNSILKLYGQLVVDDATQNGVIRIPATRLRPTEEITVNELGIRLGYVTNAGIGDIYSTRATFKTNGDIDLYIIASSQFWRSRAIYFPCVIFLKQFGDLPTP